MDQQQDNAFNNYKFCEICRRPLPETYEDSLCPDCQKEELFRKVKEYIRENDVTEYDVAYEFNISLHQVKQWIREGRIEYKDKRLNAASNTNLQCSICGAPITFGTVCPKCMKQKMAPSAPSEDSDKKPSSRIRFDY